MKKIGFLGLGLMGSKIAENLLNRNYELVSNKRGQSAELNKKFDKITLVDSPAEVAATVDLLIVCVDTAENLYDLVYSDQGVLAANNVPDFIFDLGTGRPSMIEKISDDLKARGCVYVDMPIGRTPAHALRGELNLFISSTKESLTVNIGILKDIAENLIFVKHLGQGTKIKLFNNFYGQAITLIFGKLLEQGIKVDLDLNRLLKVMSLGPLHSGIMDAVFPYFDGSDCGNIEFTINNAYKDLVYFKEECAEDDLLVKMIIALFETAISKGFGEKSVGEVSKYVD